MKLEKYINDDNDILFNITELTPKEYKAIVNGLNLLKDHKELLEGVHCDNMLRIIKKFKESED